MEKIVETDHERGPEHVGFRAEHENLMVGFLGLAGCLAGTIGLMAWFYKQNQKDHDRLFVELDALWDFVGEHEVSRRRRKLPVPDGDELVELPTYSRSRPTLLGAIQLGDTADELERFLSVNPSTDALKVKCASLSAPPSQCSSRAKCVEFLRRVIKDDRTHATIARQASKRGNLW